MTFGKCMVCGRETVPEWITCGVCYMRETFPPMVWAVIHTMEMEAVECSRSKERHGSS